MPFKTHSSPVRKKKPHIIIGGNCYFPYFTDKEKEASKVEQPAQALGPWLWSRKVRAGIQILFWLQSWTTLPGGAASGDALERGTHSAWVHTHSAWVHTETCTVMVVSAEVCVYMQNMCDCSCVKLCGWVCVYHNLCAWASFCAPAYLCAVGMSSWCRECMGMTPCVFVFVPSLLDSAWAVLEQGELLLWYVWFHNVCSPGKRAIEWISVILRRDGVF